MKFDFRYAKGNTVDVNENFNEAALKVKLKGKSDLDKNTLKVTINDKEMKYDASKIYGPYPQNKDISVSATGMVKDKTFTSTSKTIKAKDLETLIVPYWTLMKIKFLIMFQRKLKKKVYLELR